MASEMSTKLEELAHVIARLSQGAEEARLQAINLCDALKLELERPEETLLRNFWAQVWPTNPTLTNRVLIYPAGAPTSHTDGNPLEVIPCS